MKAGERQTEEKPTLEVAIYAAGSGDPHSGRGAGEANASSSGDCRAAVRPSLRIENPTRRKGDANPSNGLRGGGGGGGRTYPHPPVADGWPVVRQPQDEQIHLVLPAAADAETEALHALLQLHREEVEVLSQLGQTRKNPPDQIPSSAEETEE